jgi:hypothetical protein
MKSIYKQSSTKRSNKNKQSRSKKSKRSIKKGKRSTQKRSTPKRSILKKTTKKQRLNKKYAKRMRGGGCCGPNNFETGGKPWGPNNWPAVTPGPHDGSYYPLNMNAIDPPMPVNQLQYGGGFLSSIIPSDIMTASRGLLEGVKSNYYGWKGLARSDSSYPSPTVQPSLEREQARNIPLPINMERIHLDAGKNAL